MTFVVARVAVVAVDDVVAAVAVAGIANPIEHFAAKRALQQQQQRQR